MENANRKNDLKSGIKNQTSDVFKWWNDRSTIRPEDTTADKIKRILIRVGGVILLVAFSPVLLLALLVAFLVAL